VQLHTLSRALHGHQPESRSAACGTIRAEDAEVERSKDTRLELLDVLARATAIAAVLAGGALVWAASSVYPGGTAWNPATEGHDLWFNFLCDLQRTTARGGQPNTVASRLTQTAMATLAVSFMAHFWLATRLSRIEGQRAPWVLVLGAVCSTSTLILAFMPTDLFGAFHDVALGVATVPGLTAVAILIPALAVAPEGRLAAVVATAFSLTAAIDFALYTNELWGGVRVGPLVAVLERVSFLLLLVFMLVVSLANVDER
jgi:hypothetical protein